MWTPRSKPRGFEACAAGFEACVAGSNASPRGSNASPGVQTLRRGFKRFAAGFKRFAAGFKNCVARLESCTTGYETLTPLPANYLSNAPRVYVEPAHWAMSLLPFALWPNQRNCLVLKQTIHCLPEACGKSFRSLLQYVY